LTAAIAPPVRLVATKQLGSKVAATATATAIPLSCSVKYFSDAAKSKKKKKKSASNNTNEDDDGEGTGKDRSLALMLQAIDAPRVLPPPPSEEEAARRYNIGREYVIGKFKEHNKIEHDLSCKLSMKQHAIAMLPKPSSELAYLKTAALAIDSKEEPGPPLWRPLPMDYPPIKGFKLSDYRFKDED